jgi:hypothetical protein
MRGKGACTLLVVVVVIVLVVLLLYFSRITTTIVLLFLLFLLFLLSLLSLPAPLLLLLRVGILLVNVPFFVVCILVKNKHQLPA